MKPTRLNRVFKYINQRLYSKVVRQDIKDYNLHYEPSLDSAYIEVEYFDYESGTTYKESNYYIVDINNKAIPQKELVKMMDNIIGELD